MIKVGIIGGAGYTAGELIRLLLNHPEAKIVFVNSSSNAGNKITDVHEGLYGETDLVFTDQLPLEEIDVLFFCTAHGDTKKFLESHNVPEELKIIDLSMDYRIASPEHDFIYGLPELNRRATCKAKHVANPGCFATCIQLPTDEFMQALRQTCTETGTVLILDEIQSGYGRSGKFFAHQYNGIKADIITVAKGIGNGFPMAGVLISPMFTPVYGQLGTTFGGNHLACSAALAVLDVIEQESLIENAAQVGNFLITELKKFPQIKEVRGRGLMIGLEFEEPIKELRLRLLKEQHVFTGVSGTNVLRLLPPLCLSMDEAKEFLERFKKVL